MDTDNAFYLKTKTGTNIFYAGGSGQQRDPSNERIASLIKIMDRTEECDNLAPNIVLAYFKASIVEYRASNQIDTNLINIKNTYSSHIHLTAYRCNESPPKDQIIPPQIPSQSDPTESTDPTDPDEIKESQGNEES